MRLFYSNDYNHGCQNGYNISPRGPGSNQVRRDGCRCPPEWCCRVLYRGLTRADNFGSCMGLCPAFTTVY